jgi:hypothetical protein
MCADPLGIWSLYGVLSHEAECGETHKNPDVFSSVPDFKGWIDHVIGAA